MRSLTISVMLGAAVSTFASAALIQHGWEPWGALLVPSILVTALIVWTHSPELT